MKTKNIFEVAIQVSTSAIVALLLTACPGNDSKKNTAAIGGYVPGCPGCAIGAGYNGGSILAAAIGQRLDSLTSLELGIQVFSGTPGAYPQNYYGPVVSTGYIYIENSMGATCPILPTGIYQIQTGAVNGSYAPDTTSQAFNLANYQFSIVSNSGYSAQVFVDYLEFYDLGLMNGLDNRQYYHGLYGQIRIAPNFSIPGCSNGVRTYFFPRP